MSIKDGQAESGRWLDCIHSEVVYLYKITPLKTAVLFTLLGWCESVGGRRRVSSVVNCGAVFASCCRQRSYRCLIVWAIRGFDSYSLQMIVLSCRVIVAAKPSPVNSSCRISWEHVGRSHASSFKHCYSTHRSFTITYWLSPSTSRVQTAGALEQWRI